MRHTIVISETWIWEQHAQVWYQVLTMCVLNKNKFNSVCSLSWNITNIESLTSLLHFESCLLILEWFHLILFVSRCLPFLLDSILRGSHDEGPVWDMWNLILLNEHSHMAGLREQCIEPHHLHRLQYWVPQVFPQVSTQHLLLLG